MAKAQAKAATETDTAVIDEPQEQEPEAQPTPRPNEPPAAKPGKNKGPLGKIPTFFEQMERIDTADWGTRAVLTLYRLAPIIDQLRETENKYIAKYSEPIDMERIKLDHGCGRYRIYLNYKVPAAKESREVDSIEFDINDGVTPPNLPIGDWLDYPKNRQWAWARPLLEKREADKKKQADPQPPGMNTADVLTLYREITRDVRSQHEPQQPTGKSAASDLTALVEAAKNIADLKTPTAAAPSTDIETALKPIREDMKYYRERADALQNKLFEALANKNNGSGMDTFTNVLKQITDIIPQVKNLGADAGRSRMSGSEEFWQGIINTGIDKLSPLLTGIGQFMIARAMQAPPRPAPGPAPQAPTHPPVGLPTPTQQPQPQPATTEPLTPEVQQPTQPTQPEQMNGLIMMIGETVATALADGKTGDDYAANFEGLFGAAAYDQLSALDKDRLLQIFQNLPMWEKLGILQAKVPLFIEQFLEYGQEDAEPAGAVKETES